MPIFGWNTNDQIQYKRKNDCDDGHNSQQFESVAQCLQELIILEHIQIVFDSDKCGIHSQRSRVE